VFDFLLVVNFIAPGLIYILETAQKAISSEVSTDLGLSTLMQ